MKLFNKIKLFLLSFIAAASTVFGCWFSSDTDFGVLANSLFISGVNNASTYHINPTEYQNGSFAIKNLNIVYTPISIYFSVGLASQTWSGNQQVAGSLVGDGTLDLVTDTVGLNRVLVNIDQITVQYKIFRASNGYATDENFITSGVKNITENTLTFNNNSSCSMFVVKNWTNARMIRSTVLNVDHETPFLMVGKYSIGENLNLSKYDIILIRCGIDSGLYESAQIVDQSNNPVDNLTSFSISATASSTSPNSFGTSAWKDNLVIALIYGGKTRTHQATNSQHFDN